MAIVQVLLLVVTLCLLPLAVSAGQSVITEADGKACVEGTLSGDTVSVESAAVEKAKANAMKRTLLHLKESQAGEDVPLYERGTVRVLNQLRKEWDRQDASKGCVEVVVQAEVIPQEKTAPQTQRGATRGITVKQSSSKSISMPQASPNAPLQAKVWTDKERYRQGEKITVYIWANKSFFGRVVYKDASGQLTQLLPNPFRTENEFSGGIVYEIPSGRDQFELEVGPPFGREEIILYASTSPLGDIDVKPAGGVYEVKLAYSEVSIRTRGMGVTTGPPAKIASSKKPVTKYAERATHGAPSGAKQIGFDGVSEFFEDRVAVLTGR